MEGWTEEDRRRLAGGMGRIGGLVEGWRKVENLTKIYRTSIEHLSKIYGSGVYLGCIWGVSGGIGGTSGVHLECIWRYMGSIWSVSGYIWGVSESILGVSGSILG